VQLQVPNRQVLKRVELLGYPLMGFGVYDDGSSWFKTKVIQEDHLKVLSKTLRPCGLKIREEYRDKITSVYVVTESN
jgi:hypothetical protein